jgi:hypothetical protein
MKIYSEDYQRFMFSGPDSPMAASDNMIARELDVYVAGFDVAGQTVLDVGCDFGYWCWKARRDGASEVLGIDRGRVLRGEDQVTDLAQACREIAMAQGVDHAHFKKMEVGTQYHDVGKWKRVYCMNMYHHAYAAAGGDHVPIWYWLARATEPGGELLWVGPTDFSDKVASATIESNRDGYDREQIWEAASRYFEPLYSTRVSSCGEPGHYRELWRLRRKLNSVSLWRKGAAVNGAGGATRAWTFSNGRRIQEVENILGEEVLPGSLNIVLEEDFPWDEYGYFQGSVLDVVDREDAAKVGLDKTRWHKRRARFYPVAMRQPGTHAVASGYVFRFLGEEYPLNFVEVVSPVMLRRVIYEVAPATMKYVNAPLELTQ